MQIVIDIPEEEYEDIIYSEDCGLHRLTRAIANGTPLPEGHGRLIDADVLDRDLENAQVNLGDALSEAFDDGLAWASEVVSKSPTIIEADKAESEDT